MVGIKNLEQARNDLLSRKQEIIDLANSFHPRMVARGGGAIDFSIKTYAMESFDGEMLIVNIDVNTQDAMGANLVNGMCEGIAPLVESITEGKVFLRILSNLTDQSIAKATMRIPLESLSKKVMTLKKSGMELLSHQILQKQIPIVHPLITKAS